MQTIAQMYEISQTKLDELCNVINVYPIPDYEGFFINREGNLYMIAIGEDGKISLKPITPNKIEKNGICEYSISNPLNEIEHKTNVWLCARTFYGYFPEEYIKLLDNKFIDSRSIQYDLGEILAIGENTLSIRGIRFKRIYYQGTKYTECFISAKGVLYNNIKRKISPHQFQHNMYHRHYVVVREGNQYYQHLVSTHRLVFNTWNNTWISDKKQINHIDGAKYHNILENLEEVTQIENMKHARRTGLKSSPYNEEFIDTLCQLIEENKYDPHEMCSIMGLSKKDYSSFKSLVYHIVTGSCWSSISSKYDFSAYRNQKHSRKTERYVDDICKTYVESGYDIDLVRAKFPHISKSHIDACCRGAVCPEIAAKYGLPRKDITRDNKTKVKFEEARKLFSEGKKINEIASMLGVHASTLKSYIASDLLQQERKFEEGSTTIETIT